MNMCIYNYISHMHESSRISCQQILLMTRIQCIARALMPIRLKAFGAAVSCERSHAAHSA